MFKPHLVALSLLAFSNSSLAASIAFEDPASTSWGGWSRSAESSVYVHWEEFDAFVAGSGGTTVLPDTVPDISNYGSDFSALTPNNPGSFITGGGAGGNIYSFSDTADFSVVVDAASAHESAAAGTLRVALQIAFAGTEIDDSSVKLLGSFPFTEKIVLVQADAGGEFGGVQNEYIYLWDFVDNAPLPLPLAAYVFEFNAQGSSMSLDAVAVDIGVLSSATPVPLPASIFFMSSSLCLLFRSRVRAII